MIVRRLSPRARARAASTVRPTGEITNWSAPSTRLSVTALSPAVGDATEEAHPPIALTRRELFGVEAEQDLPVLDRRDEGGRGAGLERDVEAAA